MKHYEHYLLVKTVDGTPLSSLKTRDKKQVIFICEKCNKETQESYNRFYQLKYKFCRECINKEFKKFRSELTKNNWNNEEYRNKVSKRVSEGQKKSWKNKSRKKSWKEKYYWELKKWIEEIGYELLTSLEDYLYGNAYVKYKCSNGHINHNTYKKWKKSRIKCKTCEKEKQEKRLYDCAKEAGFTILEIKNEKVLVQCKNGHISEISKYNLHKLQGCGQCDFEGKGSSEEALLEKLFNDLDVDYIKNNRNIIYPYELDFYLPKYNLAIEYNGYPFHTEMYGKNKNDHLKKTILCEKQNIQLIHIFYDELLYEKDKTFKKLNYILGKEDRKLYARKCKVKEINYKDARSFCESYHLQNYHPSKIKLGLFYDKELVSVMTFGKTYKESNEYNDQWELIRYCSKCNVIGGASKLLNYFKRNYNWNKIITYADRRWSKGDLYYKLGFDFIKFTKPNYYYINSKSKGNKIREHRFKYRKNIVKNWNIEGDTEEEIMKNAGFTKIWGCGHMKFEMKNI